MLAEGMRPGYAAEDGAALHFEGERLARVVASRAGRPRAPDALDRQAREPAPARVDLPRRAEAGAAPVEAAGGAPVGGGRLRRVPPRSQDPRRIVAMGGGGFSAPPGDPALDLYVLQVARSPHPRICLLPTAGGDAEHQIRRFYSAFRHLPCEPTHVSLFRLGSDRVDLREVLLSPGRPVRRAAAAC